MSADISTDITIKGTHEDLLNVLNVIAEYTNDRKRRATLENFTIHNNTQKMFFSPCDKFEKITQFIGNTDEITVEAEGPYGNFGRLVGIGLFQSMAEASPDAYFSGEMRLEQNEVEETFTAELSKGKLSMSDYYIDDIVCCEWNKTQLPLPLACKLFKIDEGSMDDQKYWSLINSLFYGSDFGGFDDFESFIDFCDENEIKTNLTEEEYFDTSISLRNLNLAKYMYYVDVDDGFCTNCSIYNPIDKKYIQLPIADKVAGFKCKYGNLYDYWSKKVLNAQNDSERWTYINNDIYEILKACDLYSAYLEGGTTDKKIQSDIQIKLEEFSNEKFKVDKKLKKMGYESKFNRLHWYDNVIEIYRDFIF
jgi:hypothetical protein